MSICRAIEQQGFWASALEKRPPLAKSEPRGSSRLLAPAAGNLSLLRLGDAYRL